MKRTAIALTAVLFLFIICVLFSADNKHMREVNLPLKEVCAEYAVPACSAVIMRGGKTTASGNYGGVAADSVYCIGSVSKSFVGALALKLQEDNILRLDDTIGKYLPEFPYWNKDDVTLRALLSMRSGIADYMTDFQREDYFREYERSELIQMGLNRSVLLPRNSFAYSNTNILIARLMIEKAAGKDCETLIREKILIPLGLSNTFFANEKKSIRHRLVSGYSDTANEKRVDFTNAETSWADLACGMYAAASDMARWGYALICSDFLNDASKKELLNFLPATESTDYGLCLLRKTSGGESAVLLQGNVPGYGAAVLVRGDMVCAVLCNLSDYSGGGLSYAEGIADKLLLSYD